MKTVSVAEAQEHLPELVQLVANGEEIQLVQEQNLVAKLVPAGWEAKKIDWSETWAKVDAVFEGKPARGKPGSEIVIEGRR